MSNETEHTPGPWHREHHPDVCYYRHQIFDDAGGHVADVTCYCQHPDVDPPGSRGDTEDPSSRANADLIAAAPELLEAAEKIRDTYMENGIPKDAGPMQDILQAIAKAKRQT